MLPTLEAIDILRRQPNLLDFPSVYGAMGAPVEVHDANGFATIGGTRQPTMIVLGPGARKLPAADSIGRWLRLGMAGAATRFPGVTITENIRFSGRRDVRTDIYAPDVAVADINLMPDADCVRIADLTARFGDPTSSHLDRAAGTGDYSWVLVQSSRRRVTLSVARVGLLPTDARTVPGWARFRDTNLFGPPKTDCVWFPFGIEEVRPRFRFSDIRPLPDIPPEPAAQPTAPRAVP